MARRRVVYPVDTSDWMANMLLVFLIVAAVAVLALIVFIDSEDEQVTAQEAATGVAATPGGAGTVVPSPTSQPTGVTGGAAVDQESDEPVAGATTEPEVAVPPPVEDMTPLRPRGMRSEQVGTEAPVLPPPDEDAGVEEPNDDVTVEEPPGGPGVDEPGPGAEALGPTSPLDDPDRVPALVISDRPRDIHTVLVDLDGDAALERVWAALVRNTVQIRVQRDLGGFWADVATATGAVADDLVNLEVEDLTGDGRPEIHTRQWVGVNGESVTLWSYADVRLRAMPANGGCWDGETTFGVVGARVDPGRVIAICMEHPLPPYLWSTEVYRWVDGRWTSQRRVGVYG